MVFPISFTWFGMPVLLHTITELLAFFVGFRYFIYLRKRQSDPIDTHNRIWIIIGAIFGSIVGSRLIGGLEDVPKLLDAPNKLLYFYANKTVLGGLLFGVWGVELMKKIIGEKNNSGDLFTFPILLALIIGRVGCFSMGVYEETYGIVTQSGLGINLGDGKMRHPVALYEIGFLICLWYSLWLIRKKNTLASGQLFKFFMIGYLVFRWLLDFIKPHYNLIVQLSTIQVTCIAGLAYYILVLAIKENNNVRHTLPH
jgi:phosphatidylglycerol---prolipoprotein diacylglyceryl transferase